MSNYLLLVIICLFGASYLPRLFPMMYFAKHKVPEWFSEWMKFVPISLFAALVFKDVFLTDNAIDLIGNMKIIAMLIVAVVAYKSRSMAISVLTGLAVIFLLNFI